MLDAGVVQWQNAGLPSRQRGFDSLLPLHFLLDVSIENIPFFDMDSGTLNFTNVLESDTINPLYNFKELTC